MSEEYLNIVNDKDEIIGLRSRADVHKEGLLHREIHVWILDLNNEIFFQKRGLGKSSGGLLDASVGGHVDIGENYVSAALRELYEESGLKFKEEDLVLLKKIRLSSQDKIKKTVNNVYRSIFVLKPQVPASNLKKENEDKNVVISFEKFSIDALLKLSSEQARMFDKFILSDEIPMVMEYMKSNNL